MCSQKQSCNVRTRWILTTGRTGEVERDVLRLLRVAGRSLLPPLCVNDPAGPSLTKSADNDGMLNPV
jgi:hypothetical protein